MLRKRRKKARAKRPGGEVNMTPILDMTFLLLIAFIITFPALQSGINVQLPTAAKADPLDQEKPIVVTINAEGRVFLGDEEMTDSTLTERISALVKQNPKVAAHIRGDETQSYGRIMDVIKILHQCKLSRFSLVTQTE